MFLGASLGSLKSGHRTVMTLNTGNLLLAIDLGHRPAPASEADRPPLPADKTQPGRAEVGWLPSCRVSADEWRKRLCLRMFWAPTFRAQHGM